MTEMAIETATISTVKQALYEREIYKMSVTNALGCGEQQGYHETYRGAEIEVTLLKKIRIEIALNDDFVQPAIDGIIQGAKTGKIGDGKIFVTNLEQVIRIRTGETDRDAL